MNQLIKRSVTGLTLFTLLAGASATALAEVGGTITRSVEVVPISAQISPESWKGHWAEATFSDLITRSILSSRYLEDSRLTPESTVTVAQAAELLLIIGKLPVAADRNVVDEAVAQGLIQATDFADEKVDAEAPVSRELFTLWTARATGQMMMAEMAMIYMHPDFSDADQINGRYRNAVALLQGQGIVGGYAGQFKPQQQLILAEGLQIVKNALHKAEIEATLPVGTYKAELPAASSPGRSVELTLADDGTVTWVTDYQNGKEPIKEVGTWYARLNGMLEVVVSLTGQEGKTYEEPANVRFHLDDGKLTATSYDFDHYGREGFEFTKQ